MATFTYYANNQTTNATTRVYDDYMGTYLKLDLTVEYTVDGSAGQARAKLTLDDYTTVGTNNRYACELWIAGTKVFTNKTLKGWTSGYNQVSGDTGWSSWVSFTAPTDLAIKCDIAQTGKETDTFSNFQQLNGSWNKVTWVNNKTINIQPSYTNPVIDGTVTSNAVGAGTYSYSVTTAGSGNVSSQTWTFKNSSGTTLATKTNSSGTVTGLGSNKLINWSLAVATADGGSASDSGSFYTRHTAPSIGSVSVSVGTRSSNGTYSGTISYPVTYDGTSYSSHSFKYGTSSSNLTSSATSKTTGTSASWSISGLAPNTTYYYQITETDNGSAATTSATKTGSFKTTALKPTINAPGFVGNTTSQITISFSATGDTNAPITGYKVYYKKTDASSYSASDSLAASTTQYTITGLSADTNYNIYVAATNVMGTTNSGGSIYSTDLNAVSLSLPTPTLAEDTENDGKFTATLKPSASVSPSRTITYTYSCSLSGVSAVTKTSATHTFTNLPEETAITFTVKAVADALGNNATDKQAQVSKSITTDSAQARVRMKINGAWVQGKLFIKKNGTWVKAKKVYIKKSGAWVQGKNQ